MVAHRLEAVFVGDVRQGDDRAVGRLVRVGAGLDEDLALLLLAGLSAVGAQQRNQDRLQEPGRLLPYSVARLEAERNAGA